MFFSLKKMFHYFSFLGKITANTKIKKTALY